MKVSSSKVKRNDVDVLKYSFSDVTANSRARLFFSYSGLQLYNAENVGLMAESGDSVIEYDDWNSSFRPPRIDDVIDEELVSQNFNAEIRVPLKSDCDVYFSAKNGDYLDLVLANDDGYNLYGWSYIKPSLELVNPTRIVTETFEKSFAIQSVTYSHGVVTVKTVSKHSFSTGDAITITGIPNYDYVSDYNTSHHVMGYNGERYMGTFKISVVDNKTFTYTTAIYGSESNDYYDIGSTGSAEKWNTIVYSVDGVVCDTVSNTKTGTLTVDDVGSFIVGDKLMLVSASGIVYENVIVTGITDKIEIRFNNILAQKIDGSYTVYYSPRVPSSSIPVNYGTVTIGSNTYTIDNTPKYGHMVNTFMTTPNVDTYFASNDGSNHSFSENIVVSGSSFGAFKFNCGYISNSGSTDGGDLECSAELSLFVNKCEMTSAPIVVKQMSSDAWTENMTYASVKSYVTNDIISSAVVSNPSGKTSELGYVNFSIDSTTVSKWLNGSNGYTPTIAVMLARNSDKRVIFNASEADSYGPILVLSGGEKAAVDPDTIPITVSTGNGEPGDTLRIYTGGGSFSSYTYNNVVRFDGVKAEITSGTKTYIDVVIPDGIVGACNIVVYATQLDGSEIQISDPCSFYVDGELSRRDVKLADKIDPGIDTSEIYRSAVYNRDLSYSNFTEVTDENSLIQNIYSCILTTRGERLFNPTFGTTIENRLYAITEAGGEGAVLRECVDAINKYEPRVTVVTDHCSAVFEQDGALHINIGVKLPSGNVEDLELTFTNRGTVV